MLRKSLPKWVSFKNICESCCKKNIHQYRNTFPWNNAVEFSDYLIKTATYHDNGLLVLNKPYGVSFSRGGGSKSDGESKYDPEQIVFTKPTEGQTKRIKHHRISGIESHTLNLVDCLPYLKKHFGYDKLHIARVPERCLSGIAILTTSKDLVEHVNKCRRHLPVCKDKYLAVVVGVPRYPEGEIKLALKEEEQPKKGKRAVLLQKWHKRAYKRGELRIGTFHHETICSSYHNLTSLIEFKMQLRVNHAYRLFAADYLYSPVLGDNLYGSRVQAVMGVPVPVDPFSDAASAPQKLPSEIYKALDLRSNDSGLIPIHVHLAEMLLPRFLKGGKSLLLTSPPPPHFLWTCDRLGLAQPEQAKIAVIK